MKKIPVWKNILLIFSVIVAVIIATFAWFYTGPRAEVYDLTVDMGEASYVQISGNGGANWSDNLDVNIGVLDGIKELSGNGTTLYAPVYDTVKNDAGGYSTEIVAFEEVEANEKHYEQIFEFRSDVDQDLYLSPDSYVKAVSDERVGYIDGAIRVGFYEVDANGREFLKCIWAPSSKVEFSAGTDSFKREGTVEPYYYYLKNPTSGDLSSLEDGVTNSSVAKIPTGYAHCGYNAEHKFMWSCGEDLPENAPSLLTVSAGSGDDFQYKKMKIKVWLEGYDRECVSQLSGQKFTMKLHFSAERGE